ncbi:thiaminase II, partial [archaeon]|nr:thiaminase II [archaeon]
MASVQPCMWSYQEIGEWMRDSPGLDRSPLYREWADTYVSQEYIDLVRWYRDLTDRSASSGGSRERDLMLRHFVLSSRYEYLFWEMAYEKEEWPV